MIEMNVRLTPDKAYLFGLIIGAGKIENNRLSLTFPFRSWGSVNANPIRVGEIAGDMLDVVRPVLENQYNLQSKYTPLKNSWVIEVVGDLSILKSELVYFGIKPYGELRSDFEVSGIISDMNNDDIKRKFVAGIADAVCSTASSHRRFSDDIQTVSFEINTCNFRGMSDFCRMMHSIGGYPDQVLWNHPSMHVASDSLYSSSWKKGMKLRIMADQYLIGNSFKFTSKNKSVKNNIQLQTKGQNRAKTCMESNCDFTPRTIHPGIYSSDLPEPVRGHCFMHHKQICAALGCPFAPYEEIDKQMNRIYEMISPFPLIHKGTYREMMAIMRNDEHMSNAEYTRVEYKLSQIIGLCESANSLILGNSTKSGYLPQKMLDAVNYVFAAACGELKGKRPIGDRDDRFD